MQDAGSALMGIGEAAGENRAAEAAKNADLEPAARAVRRGRHGHPPQHHRRQRPRLFEVNEAAEIIQSAADQNSNIIFGAVVDDAMGDEVRVTVIATGFDGRAGAAAVHGGAAEAPRERAPARRLDGRPAALVAGDLRRRIDIPSFLDPAGPAGVRRWAMPAPCRPGPAGRHPSGGAGAGSAPGGRRRSPFFPPACAGAPGGAGPNDAAQPLEAGSRAAALPGRPTPSPVSWAAA